MIIFFSALTASILAFSTNSSGVMLIVFKKLMSRLSYGSRVAGFFTAALNRVIESPSRRVLSILVRVKSHQTDSGSEGLEPSTNCSAGSHSIQAELWALCIIIEVPYMSYCASTAVTRRVPEGAKYHNHNKNRCVCGITSLDSGRCASHNATKLLNWERAKSISSYDVIHWDYYQ